MATTQLPLTIMLDKLLPKVIIINKSVFLNIFMYSLAVFIGIRFIQTSNNALPFFYKDYPTYSQNGKNNFDSTSESLVLNRIDFSTLDIKYKYMFNLWRPDAEVRSFVDYRNNKEYNPNYLTTSVYLLKGQPYRSQVGFQSLIWSKLSQLFNSRHGDYYLLKTISIILLSLALGFVLVWINYNFGFLPSILSLLITVLSTGINIFSMSLYWSIWLFVLPLSAVCFLELLKVCDVYAIFLITFPLFLIKFLSGYEFISTIILSALTPYIWSYFIKRNSFGVFQALSVVISSVIAFCVSVLIYVKLFLFDFKSSGLDYILMRQGSWSLKNLINLKIVPWIQLSKISVMNFFDVNGYGIPVGIFFMLVVAGIVISKKKIRIEDLKFILYLFISSISWLIFQPGHILFHPRYATLIFFFPFGLFIVGFLVSRFNTKNDINQEINA